ncbi:restriction endonuclease [Sphingobium sp. YR768]|uniref:restriction endonuclease n=1 Tax=Sphingobium sp. YR768 TaxID=1884365 RepID=UPI0008AC96D5|nr:restriction endonuclease [Sphingobium sp. YR768]SES14647.1 restriction system protein [Sphingobium sp. YR768]
MLFALSAFMLIILAVVFHQFEVPVKHRWRRRQARAMAAQLRGRDRAQPPQLLYARLRAMDPLAFEELLLESFERSGHKVVRNRRYTGDGGVDGQVVIDGAVWLIQAKRYADTIRPEHVAAFEALCRTKGCRGLFIHTGRTGPQSRAAAAHGGTVEIISGRALLALLTDGLFPDFSGLMHHDRTASKAMRAV